MCPWVTDHPFDAPRLVVDAIPSNKYTQASHRHLALSQFRDNLSLNIIALEQANACSVGQICSVRRLQQSLRVLVVLALINHDRLCSGLSRSDHWLCFFSADLRARFFGTARIRMHSKTARLKSKRMVDHLILLTHTFSVVSNLHVFSWRRRSRCTLIMSVALVTSTIRRGILA